MSALRKIKRVGKKASKFQYTATYQSVVIECQRIETWKPNQICVSWSRRGRRFFSHRRPWQTSSDNPMRGVVIWPEKEVMETTVTLYKSPKDTSYENKEWEFHIIDVDTAGKRKILAVTAINMVRYASTMPFDHDVQLQLKPVSRKIKRVILDITLCSVLLKEGKATDDDMLSIASMLSVSNLSMIGNLEDDDEDGFGWHGGRSITPPMPQTILSPEELLKWTQEVTAGYRGVRVTNMTTSWRTGMGFLAIIHYHTPNLIDIEAVSPNAIKENNKLAFELAHHLGISCPLTPSAMISATIPDKLLVSSFLFNMHQYFTRALPSAIAMDGTANGNAGQTPTSADKPSSPFDISKIHKVFDDPNIYSNLSPVTSPSHSGENRYSRHSSRRNSEEQEAGGRSVPVSGDHGVKTHSSSSSLVVSNRREDGGGEMNSGQVAVAPGQGLGGYSGQVAVAPGQGGGIGSIELGAALDELVGSSHSQAQRGVSSVPSITVSVGAGEGISEGGEREREVDTSRKSTEEDRLLEFEGETESEPHTNSSVSLDNSQSEGTVLAGSGAPLESVAEQDTPNTAVDTSQDSVAVREGEGESVGGTEPPAGQEEAEEEGEERERVEGQRRKSEALRGGERVVVEEMGRRKSDVAAGSRPHRRLPAVPTGSPEVNAKDEERRQKAKELLRKHPASADFFSTSSSSPSPTGRKKSMDSKQEKYREQVRMMLSGLQSSSTSPSSSRAHPSTDEPNELEADRSTASLPEILEEPSQPPNTQQPAADREEELEKTRERAQSLESSEIVSYESEPRAHRASGDAMRRVGVIDRPQVVVVGGGEDSAPLSATTPRDTPGNGDKSQRGSGQTKEAPPTSLTQLRSHQRKAQAKGLQIKPVQSKPSAAAQRLLESKKSGGGGAETNDGAESGGGWGKGEKGDGGVNGDSGEKQTAAGGTKMDSPSPWEEHSVGLEKDILLTRNEYIRCELGRLQAQLQNMERRAVEIETDVRHAMSTGNKEEEETMMQEWFSLLNAKNELIKRQIELNLIEKEEDLEKKQFFINRELRPLMEIPDDQKTTQQQERVDALVQDLLGIVDERDKLERRKMSIASKSAHHERDGFAPDNSGLPPRNTSLDRTGSKDCVIS